MAIAQVRRHAMQGMVTLLERTRQDSSSGRTTRCNMP